MRLVRENALRTRREPGREMAFWSLGGLTGSSNNYGVWLLAEPVGSKTRDPHRIFAGDHSTKNVSLAAKTPKSYATAATGLNCEQT